MKLTLQYVIPLKVVDQIRHVELNLSIQNTFVCNIVVPLMKSRT